MNDKIILTHRITNPDGRTQVIRVSRGFTFGDGRLSALFDPTLSAFDTMPEPDAPLAIQRAADRALAAAAQWAMLADYLVDLRSANYSRARYATTRSQGYRRAHRAIAHGYNV